MTTATRFLFFELTTFGSLRLICSLLLRFAVPGVRQGRAYVPAVQFSDHARKLNLLLQAVQLWSESAQSLCRLPRSSVRPLEIGASAFVATTDFFQRRAGEDVAEKSVSGVPVEAWVPH